MRILQRVFVFACIMATCSVNAQETATQVNTVVGIVLEKGCITADKALEYFSGQYSIESLMEYARNYMLKDYPEAENIELFTNLNGDTYLGGFLVVVSANVRLSNKCYKKSFGVGFGPDEDTARQAAQLSLEIRNHHFRKGKDKVKKVMEINLEKEFMDKKGG